MELVRESAYAVTAEHCIALSRPYKEHKLALQEIFARDTLQCTLGWVCKGSPLTHSAQSASDG